MNGKEEERREISVIWDFLQLSVSRWTCSRQNMLKRKVLPSSRLIDSFSFISNLYLNSTQLTQGVSIVEK